MTQEKLAGIKLLASLDEEDIEPPIDLFDPKEQYEIGFDHYENGELELAESWLRMTAEQGHREAQYYLGKVLLEALRLSGGWAREDTCYDEAIKWYRLSAELGYIDAQRELAFFYYHGSFVAQDYAEAFKWYSKAAEQKSPSSRYMVGVMYHQGLGVEQDYAQAIKYYSLATERYKSEICPRAPLALAQMYFEGDGVEVDKQEAVAWLHKAGEMGNAVAAARLGEMYFKGEVVEADEIEAMKWLYEAAKELYKAEAFRRCCLEEEGKTFQYEIPSFSPEIVAWVKDRAEQGYAPAQFVLSLWHWIGIETEKSKEKTVYWLRQSVLNGFEAASFWLSCI